MNVITPNFTAAKRLRSARKELQDEDCTIFFHAYSWVFNSICIDPDGFTASCQDASLNPGRVAAEIEAAIPDVHERFRALLQRNH